MEMDTYVETGKNSEGYDTKVNRKEKKQSPLKELAFQFGSGTTAHGFANIVGAKSTLGKLIWLFLCALCWGVFLWQAAILIVKYYEYSVSYDIAVSFTELRFPAVTVCNINPIRQSMVGDIGEEYRDDLGFLEFYTENETESEDSFDWKNVDPKVESDYWDEIADDFFEDYDTNYEEDANLTTIINRLPADVRFKIGHQKTDLIQECTFNGYKCSPNNFTRILNPKYGNCFSFNTGANDTQIHTSRRPGPGHGLLLTLFIEEKEYLEGFTESSGAVVLVHDHDIVAFPEEQGIEVPPGYATSIGVRLKQVSRLGGKYTKCTTGSTAELLYEGYAYSVEACLRLCYQKYLTLECGCYDPTLPNDDDELPVCTQLEGGISCENTVKRKYENDELGCIDECPQSCLDKSYEGSVSMSLWPSEVYDSKLFNRLSKQSKRINEQIETIEDSRRNLLRLKIYFSELNFESITEKAELTEVALLSNLGGLIGLYIGVSVLSVFEFIEFIIDIFRIMLKKVKTAGRVDNTKMTS